LGLRPPARGVTKVTDTYPEAVRTLLRQPGILSVAFNGGVTGGNQMDIPANTIGGAGAQPVQQVVVDKHHGYTFALTLICLALGVVVASVIFPDAFRPGGEFLLIGP